MTGLREEIADVLNRHSVENRSNSPDFILAQYLERCLEAFEEGITSRDKWYGIAPSPGEPMTRA